MIRELQLMFVRIKYGVSWVELLKPTKRDPLNINDNLDFYGDIIFKFTT
jgi:hypothetical protein